jgi:hypothetical protein
MSAINWTYILTDEVFELIQKFYSKVSGHRGVKRAQIKSFKIKIAERAIKSLKHSFVIALVVRKCHK